MPLYQNAALASWDQICAFQIALKGLLFLQTSRRGSD
jgi:hypothetical protein